MRRLGFMSMYENNFVLRWVMSIGAAEQLAKTERFEFALVNYDPDPQRAIEFCESLKKIQPQIRVIFLKTERKPLPPDFCADLVLERDLTDDQLADALRRYLRVSA